MATVPKRRQSRARRNKRRSHDALALPARAACPQCGEPRQPHRVCGNCGQYGGRTVFETDEE
jgi:large subunit ribosomal protein L32